MCNYTSKRKNFSNVFTFVIYFILNIYCVNKNCYAMLCNDITTSNKIIQSYCDELSKDSDELPKDSNELQNALIDICNEAGIKLNDNFSVNNILNFVELTQEKFFNRKNGAERWHTKDLTWINSDNNCKILNNMKILGFYDKILPKNTCYDAICILGATMPSMKSRIRYVEELVTNGKINSKYIVLLTGERYLVTEIDASDEELLKLSEYFQVSKEKLTETHAFRYLYDSSKLKDNFELIIVDTPQRNGVRPTTQTTVEDFLKLPNFNFGSLLFISSQPSVKYQNSIINEVITKLNKKLKFETIGGTNDKQNLQRSVNELGAYIWAYTPRILRKMDPKELMSCEENLEKLYSHQPLIYNNILSNWPELSK